MAFSRLQVASKLLNSWLGDGLNVHAKKPISKSFRKISVKALTLENLLENCRQFLEPTTLRELRSLKLETTSRLATRGKYRICAAKFAVQIDHATWKKQKTQRHGN